MTNRQDIESGQYSGAAWHDPVYKKFYGGHIGNYQGGILTDIAAIESKVVLEELLGLMRPDYTLEGAVTIVNTPPNGSRLPIGIQVSPTIIEFGFFPCR